MRAATRALPHQQVGGHTVLALVFFLALYSAFIGFALDPIPVESGRSHWWLFWIVLIASRSITLILTWLALRKGGDSWLSIGLDWGWFLQHKKPLAGLLALLAAAAIIAPGLSYGDILPLRSGTLPIAPVTSAERLTVLCGVLTVSVAEEVVFRGFALTQLTRIFGNSWLALLITVPAFIFVHGVPEHGGDLFFYVAAGIAYGALFILMRLRRLEVLIMIHFLSAAGLVLSP